MTKTLLHRVFGGKVPRLYTTSSPYPSTPPNLGLCEFTLKKYATQPDIEIYDTSVFSRLVAPLTGGLKASHPSGLGKGAIYASYKSTNFAAILFQAGPYSIFIDGVSTHAWYSVKSSKLSLEEDAACVCAGDIQAPALS